MVYSAAIRKARSADAELDRAQADQGAGVERIDQGAGPVEPIGGGNGCAVEEYVGVRFAVGGRHRPDIDAAGVGRQQEQARPSPSSIVAGISTVSASWAAGTSSLAPSSRQFAPSRRAVVAGSASGRSGRALADPRTGCGFRR